MRQERGIIESVKKLCFLAVFLAAFLLGSMVFPTKTSSDELDDINRELVQLQQALSQSRAATAPLESQLGSLRRQIDGIKGRVAVIEQDIALKRQHIDAGYRNLEGKERVLAATVRNYYIKSYYNSPLLVLLSTTSASEITQVLFYQKVRADQDKALITTLALSISDLETKKQNLESEQARLAKVKATLDEESEKLDTVVKGAKAYQAQILGKIAQLSTRQQQIIAQKLGSLNLPTSLGAGPLFCTDDRKIDPGFSPGLAFFTFGIPHRVGMNQYGAYGRAKEGQSYQDILRTYFDGVSFQKQPNITIKVEGFSQMPLEQYLLGIYEMPDSFPMEALKAQVVAARSYAIAYTGSGEREICTTQVCQVYKGGNKGGNWEQAVRATEGEVMVRDGAVITAWYASTSGGYTFTSGDVGWSNRAWTKRLRDTNGDVSSFSDLAAKAFDRESPCFYAAQGVRNEFAKSAWLRPSEVADILNVILLVRQDSASREHLYQVDKPNPSDTDTWGQDRVKQELKSRGVTPFTSVASITIDWDKSAGRTTSISVSGDGGSVSFEGLEFKNFFNLRAPANIQIVGPLYTIERR